MNGLTEFAEIPGPITNFDCATFLNKYDLRAPVAANWFVAIYTSESPFSGKPFHGNDVPAIWRKDLDQAALRPTGNYQKP